ncbi:MAG: hypothetical protein LBQ94_00535 [Treponema sp.]|nr:hypothetical protein [Treponema sp.]
MKNSSFFWLMLVVTLSFGLTLTGCETFRPTAPPAGIGALYEENRIVRDFPVISVVPLKDFTSLGIVLTENVIRDDQGEVFTYYALLKEAQKLGADTIINVSIGKKKRAGSTDETWYGAATAIKYLEGTLTDVILMSSRGGNFGIDSSAGILLSSGIDASSENAASSEVKWYNPFTWF